MNAVTASMKGPVVLSAVAGRDVAARHDLFDVTGEAARAARAVAWDAGPLGPVSGWDECLRTAVQVVMSSRAPMLLIWGPAMTQIYNDAYRQVIGDKHPAAMGASTSQTWAEVWETIGPLIASVLRGDGPVGQDDLMLLMNRHGYVEETHWSYSYSPWPAPAGGVAGVLVVAHEVTESVLARRADAARTRFYENAGHELRSPLTILGLAVEVLKPHVDDSSRQHLRAMTRALERLNELVDTLLSSINGDGRAFEPRFEDVDLTEATEAVLAMFPTVASEAGLTLTTEIDQVGEVEVDPEAWRRLVANLVSNAVKYTSDGGVTVRLTRGNGDVHLEVSDTGLGIDDADQATIFERFRRGDAGRVRDSGGLGLGLSLVDDLVRVHHGHVTVRSRPGDGATFTVDLPRHRPGREAPLDQGPGRALGERAPIGPTPGFGGGAPVEVGLAAAGVLSASGHDGEFAEPVGEAAGAAVPLRGRLLLVEDDDDLRGHLTGLLTRDGWQVTGVADVAGAVACSVPPDLVLTDILMPGPSGLDLVRLLRAQPGWDSLPIVLLTGRVGTDAMIEGLEAGADDYIAKPFHSGELLARLAVHSEMARKRRAACREAEARADNLEVALHTNRRIGLALGILMSRYRLTDEQAFAMLRETSNNRNQRVRDIAEQVIMTGWLDGAPERRLREAADAMPARAASDGAPDPAA